MSENHFFNSKINYSKVKQALKLFQFRLQQIFRFIKTIGWVYLIFIFPILFIFVLSLLESIQQFENKTPLLLAYLLPLAIHTKRPDFAFLIKIKVKRFYLFLLEYHFACLPFSLMLLGLGIYQIPILGHIMLSILALMLAIRDFKLENKQSNWALNLIPNTFFEWKTGIRRYHLFFILLWLFGCVTTLTAYTYFIFVFMFAGIIAEIFKPTEAKELKPLNLSDFYKKITRNTLFLGILLLPHLLLYCFFNPSFWWISLGIALYMLLFQLYCIAYKYAHYSQYRKQVNNELPAMLFMFLCPFLPISLLLLSKTFMDARKSFIN